jgi:AcrR family transcriptional regulator
LERVNSMKNLNLKLDNFQYYEPKQNRAKITFKLILTTAMQTIENEGIAALNTNRVADDCDVNISTLYHYFPNKDTIVYALYKTWFDSVAVIAEKHRDALAPGLDPKQFYRDMIIDMLNVDNFSPKAAVALEQAIKIRSELAEYDRLVTEASITGYIEDLRFFGVKARGQDLVLPASHMLTTVWGAINIASSNSQASYVQIAEYSAEMITALIKRLL